MQNITGNAVTFKDYLPTRLFLVDELRTLLKTTSVIIEAPRRFGKTSIIKEFIRQEREKARKNKEFITIFLELEGEESINNFCFRLFKELLGLYWVRKQYDILTELSRDIWNSIASRIKKIGLPEFGIELGEKTRNLDFFQWKEKISSMIFKLNSFDKRTIIIFDEFPDMLMNFKNKGKEPLSFKEAVDSLTGWLRTLRQKSDTGCKYQFVFCGSINLRKTLESIGATKRINDLESLVIPPMKSEESQLLIESLIKEYGIEIDEEGIRFLVTKITDGSPYYGQILFKSLRDIREKRFTVSRVKAVYEEMLRGGIHDLNHFHSRLEEYLTPMEKESSAIILKQLCYDSAPEKQLYDTCLYEKCRYEVFQSVVDRLIYEGYIMRDVNNEGEIRFVSPLLKDWWARKMGV
jgi:hypothetical protein